MDTFRFYLPMDSLVLELTHHANIMGSVLKTDRVYDMEDLEEYYVMLNVIPIVQDPFNYLV